MPYIATKSRLIAGQDCARGQVVDTSALTVAKLASLIRVGLLVQADQAPSVGVTLAPSEESELCPLCDGGPYRRLDLHMNRAHTNEESTEHGIG